MSVEAVPVIVYQAGTTSSTWPLILRKVFGLKVTLRVASVWPTVFGVESIVVVAAEIVPGWKFWSELVPETSFDDVKHYP